MMCRTKKREHDLCMFLNNLTTSTQKNLKIVGGQGCVLKCAKKTGVSELVKVEC